MTECNDIKQYGFVMPIGAKFCGVPINNSFLPLGDVFDNRHVVTFGTVEEPSISLPESSVISADGLTSPANRSNNVIASSGTKSTIARISRQPRSQWFVNVEIRAKDSCEKRVAIDKLNYIFSMAHAVISPPPNLGELTSLGIPNRVPSPQEKPNLWTFFEKRCDGQYRFIDCTLEGSPRYTETGNGYAVNATINLISPDPIIYGSQVCLPAGGTSQIAVENELPDPAPYVAEVPCYGAGFESAETGFVLRFTDFGGDTSPSNELFTIALYRVDSGDFVIMKPIGGTTGGNGWKIFNGTPPYELIIDTQLGIARMNFGVGQDLFISANQGPLNSTISDLVLHPGSPYRVIFESNKPFTVGSGAVSVGRVSGDNICYYPRYEGF